MATSSLSHWMYSFFKSDSSDSFSGFTQDDLLSDVNNIDTIHTEEKYLSDSEIDSTYQDCFPLKSNMADSYPVPNFLQVKHNMKSITITADSNKIPTIKKFLDENLHIQQGHSQNGLIYKSMDKYSTTVTLYITTGKIHVQGPGYTEWVNHFINSFYLRFNRICKIKANIPYIMVWPLWVRTHTNHLCVGLLELSRIKCHL
jgi:hypothetical protein